MQVGTFACLKKKSTGTLSCAAVFVFKCVCVCRGGAADFVLTGVCHLIIQAVSAAEGARGGGGGDGRGGEGGGGGRSGERTWR